MSCCRIDRPVSAGPAVLWRSKDEKIEYHVLAQSQIEEALGVLITGFYPDEPACSLLQVSKSAEAVKELNLLASEMAKDNVSLAAVDTEINKVVGVCFNKIQVKPKLGEPSYFDKFMKEVCKDQKAIRLIEFMSEIDAEVDIFEHFNIDKLVELVFLAVAPSHRHRGIGFDLITHSLNLFTIKSAATVASMIGTSTYTQRIGNRLNFEILAQCPYKKGDTSDSVFEKVTRFHDRSILFARQL